jgi:hypothetical protein
VAGIARKHRISRQSIIGLRSSRRMESSIIRPLRATICSKRKPEGCARYNVCGMHGALSRWPPGRLSMLSWALVGTSSPRSMQSAATRKASARTAAIARLASCAIRHDARHRLYVCPPAAVIFLSDNNRNRFQRDCLHRCLAFTVMPGEPAASGLKNWLAIGLS